MSSVHVGFTFKVKSDSGLTAAGWQAFGAWYSKQISGQLWYLPLSISGKTLTVCNGDWNNNLSLWDGNMDKIVPPSSHERIEELVLSIMDSQADSQEAPSTETRHACKCDFIDMMRYGCKCGGR